MRTTAKALFAVVSLTLLATIGVYLYARSAIREPGQVGAPSIAAVTDPSVIARGKVLVQTACAGCHTDPATGRLSGARLDFPSFFGEFYAANITADPIAGIGAMDDALIARVIRTGVKRDGTLAAMPRLPRISDDDIAAILSYLRSGDQPLTSSSTRHPAAEYTAIGTIIVAFMFPALPEAAQTGIARPQKAATAAYGRYLANDVFDCFECHTDGFGRGKLQRPGLYGGRSIPGQENGHAPNLTAHATGLGAWRFDDFRYALHMGVTPAGRVLKPPMRLLPLMDDVDLMAMWKYLRTLPPVDNADPRRAAASGAAASPPQRFAELGCAGCHGPGRHFENKLQAAANKPVAEIAAWIREPRRIIADTTMPTYATLIDEQEAAELAAWIRDTHLQHQGGTGRAGPRQ